MSISLRDAMARGRAAKAAGAGATVNGVQGHSLGTTLRQARASGTLRLIDKGLDAVPPEVCAIADLVEQDERRWELVDMRLLDLSHNAIAELPPELAQLSCVSELKLARNRLGAGGRDHALAVLAHFGELRTLDLSHNELRGAASLRAAFGPGSWPLLVSLSLRSAGDVPSLPDALCGCTALEVLDVGELGLRELPAGLGSLARLRRLSADGNALDGLPASARALNALELLDLSRNGARDQGLGGGVLLGMAGLQLLDLRHNRLRAVPALPAAPGLGQVLLSGNAIAALAPPGVSLQGTGGLAQPALRRAVVTLDLAENDVAELPAELALLEAMRTLDVRNNGIRELPAALGYVRALTRLLLVGNPLRSLKRAFVADDEGQGRDQKKGCGELKRFLRTRGTPHDGMVDPELDDGAAERGPLLAAAADGADARFGPAVLDAVRSGLGAGGDVDLAGLLDAGADADGGSGAGAGAGAGEGRNVLPLSLLTAQAAAQADAADAEHAAAQGWAASLGGASLHAVSSLRLSRNPRSLGGGLPRDLLLLGGSLRVLEAERSALASIAPLLPADAVGAEALAAFADGNAVAAVSRALLGGAPAFGALASLSLRHNALAAEALDAAALYAAAPALEHLDLRNNRLERMPRLTAAAPRHGQEGGLPRLHTLLLGYNAMSQLQRPALPVLPSLTHADLSNNALHDVSALVHALVPAGAVDVDGARAGAAGTGTGGAWCSVRTLSVENNELRAVPPRLALGPRLESLLIAGNPQRGVPPSVVSSGPAAVLARLRQRARDTLDGAGGGAGAGAGAGAVLVGGSGGAAGRGRHSPYVRDGDYSDSSAGAGGRVGNPAVAPPPLAQPQYQHPAARAAPAPAPAPAVPVRAGEPASWAEAETQRAVDTLEAAVAQLQERLESDMGLSSAKKWALKKELAVERSKLLRQKRQLKQQQDSR
eukprot:g1470.t1